MSKKIKNEQKKFLGETLNQYDKALDEAINQLDKKNREQNHKISSLVNSFDNEFLEKDVEGNMTTLENSKDGMVIINEIQGSTEVNYCKDGEKELILNGDIDTQGESFVTITEGVDGGLVDVSLEGNTEINLSKTKDTVLVTREFDDIDCNVGKLQYTIDDVTTINDEPGKVDIDRIVGDTMVNHAVNGSEELILNAHINESGDNSIKLNGVTSDGGKVDVYLEGNTLVNVSNVKDDYITPTIEDKVDQGSVISLPEASEGYVNIDSIEGNTLVNYCTDGAKELTLNGDIDVEGNSVTVTEGVDNGLVDVICEGNTLVNLITCNEAFTWVKTAEQSYCQYDVPLVYPLKANKTYTIYLTVESNPYDHLPFSSIVIGQGDTDNWSYRLVWDIDFGKSLTDKGIGRHRLTFTTHSRVEETSFKVIKFILEQAPEFNTTIKDIILIEGEHNEDLDSFEGMKSVGQDDENGHKIEITSRNKNFTNPVIKDGMIAGANGGFDGGFSPDYCSNVNYDEVYPNTQFTITSNKAIDAMFFYDKNRAYISYSNIQSSTKTFTTPSNCYYVRYRFLIANKPTWVQIEIGATGSSYIEPKSNKKEISLNEPLRSLPNGIKDRFVKIGSKWFIERNCGSATFDGSDDEKWELALMEDNAPIFFRTGTLLEAKQVLNTSLICDKVKTTTYDVLDDGSGYGINLTYFLRMNLPNCDARNGATVQDLRNYLQQNPVTVVYQLATPTYEPLEIDPILTTYLDITHISNNSIIPCTMKIKNSGYNAIIKPSTLYTVALDTNKNGTIGLNLGGAKVTTTNNIATITTPSTLTDDSLRLYGKGIKASGVRLLEGDKTNWIPSFFEGMKSSFEDKVQDDGSYKMEILMNNENLLSENLVADGTDRTETPHPIYFKKGHTYMFAIENCSTGNQIFLMKHKGYPFAHGENDIGVIQIINNWSDPKDKFIFTAEQSGHFYIQTRGDAKDTILQNPKAIVSENINATYTPNKSNKIQLSSIEPLRGVGDVKDRLVFKDGKLMIERNCRQENMSELRFAGDTSDTMQCLILFKSKPKAISNIFSNSRGYESATKGQMYVQERDGGMTYLWIPTDPMSREEFTSFLNEKNATIVYAKEEPTYEEIPYDLQKIILESYNNGTLFMDTNIPPTKVSFNCFEEELTYLYPSTSYTIQFNSDRNTTADVILGGTQLLAQSIVQGLNRISITTPSELVDNKLVINGAGAKINDVVVTDTDREFKYFEDMKSIGEYEELEVKSINKNLLDYTQLYDENNFIKKYRGYGFWTYKVKVEKGKTYTVSIGATERITIEGDTPYLCISTHEDYGKTPNEYKQWMNHSSLKFYKSVTIPSVDGYLYIQTANNINKIKMLLDNIGYIQIEEGTTATEYITHQSNIQTLTHEPLRALENVKDKYTIVDGKWYIERRCGSAIFDGSDDENWVIDNQYGDNGDTSDCVGFKIAVDDIVNVPSGHGLEKLGIKLKSNLYACTYTFGKKVNGIDYGWGKYIFIKFDKGMDIDEFKNNLKINPVEVTYPLETPIYEPIDYNPLEVYSDVTHITTNSTIPTNITVKNHGYNLVALKENTQYTLYVDKNTTNALTYRLGDYVEVNSPSKFTFTTPSTLTDKTLRIDGKGTKVKDLMLIEGTPTNDSIGYFDGLKSSYECEQVTDENDVNYGKYKVDVKVVGKNLCPNKFYSGWSNRLGTLCSDDNVVTELIKVKPNSNYTINKSDFAYLFKYDGNKKFIGQEVVFQTFNTKNAVYIKMAQSIGSSAIHLEDYNNTIQIEEGDTVTEYEPYFESKQTVYLNSPLLKDDEIVWKDNKIQHYHKMGRIVLDGSDDEGWGAVEDKGKFIKFGRDALNFKFYPGDSHKLYCDILPTNTEIVETEIERLTLFCHNENYRELRCNLLKSRLSELNVEGLKQWLQANPVTVVYQLETPYYEEISDYPLKLNVIANSSLSTESTIQVTNISFNVYEETLPYLYPNTKYYITFNADVDRNNIIINLGGNHVVLDCKVGFNKVEITTPSDTTNLLTFSGTGVNIDHVKVTQQDIDEYFEGMKSVGECEELAITSANSDNSLSNSQALTHEPLRARGNVKDKYTLIDGKWYIERRCGSYTATSNEVIYSYTNDFNMIVSYYIIRDNNFKFSNNNNCISNKIKNIQQGWNSSERGLSVLTYNSENRVYFSGYTQKEVKSILEDFTVIYELATPVYEPIDYNPFETYSDITHITANSLIPTNMVIKNHGYNCILKPSTKYTVALNKPNGTISAKLGGSTKVDSTNNIFTITTPSTLNDNVLRLSGSGKVKDIMILEGDKTVNTPSYFEGIESGFEQEYDVEKGKYRVTAKVEGNGKESSIIFYIDEPLRGTATAKDKVFIQDGKVVVERNCSSITLDGSKNIHKANTDFDSVNNISFSIDIDNIAPSWANCNNIVCSTLPNVGNRTWKGNMEGITSNDIIILLCISRNKLQTQDVNGFKQWLQANPTKVVYVLAEPVYEEADCDLSKLVLENYENSSLIFESNIPVSANIKYSGEVPVVTQAKTLSSQVDNTTLDINENIIPYMCDIDYRIVELQLMNGDTQGEGIELLGIGDIEILGNENVLFNNREDKKHNFSYDMLKRDILSQRYSKEEYQYRLDRYLLANKISDEEYKELEGLLNNGE